MPKRIRLHDAATEYANHCLARKLAPDTVRSNTVVLGQVEKQLGNVWVDNLTARAMDKVFASVTWAPSTFNQRLGQLRSFFTWCRARSYLSQTADPLFGWRTVKVPDTPRTRIARDEWGRLFDACVHQQERALVSTGLYLFLRGSEQKHIQLKHVHLAEGEIEIYRVKTKKWDVMPISSELDEHLRLHLRWLAECGSVDPNNYLIPARKKDLGRGDGKFQLGTGSIQPEKPVGSPHIALQRVFNRAGYPTRWEGEHTLRRSGARAYFDSLVGQGYDGALRRVQSMLGHAHSQMTERYLGLDLDRVARNTDLRGRPMFPTSDENVIPLRRVQTWQSDS